MAGTPGTLMLMLDAAWRVTLLLAVAWGVARLLGHRPAAVRHSLWAAALAAALGVPMLAVVVPSWQVAVLPAELGVGSAVLPKPTAPPSRPLPPPAIARLQTTAPLDLGAPAAPGTAVADRDTAVVPTPAGDSNRPSATRSPADWLGLLWASVAAAIIGRYFASVASVRWLTRDAETVHDLRWRDACDVAAAELGLSRTPSLLASDHVTVPFTSGVFRPVVVVPSSALAAWTDERVRVVLLHELAHVRRRDCLVQALAQVACAAYWFNPLTWVAARRLRAERERACDDLVLEAGLRGADYAQHLLDIARTVTPRRSLAAAALAMARPSELEGRLLAILDQHRQRRQGGVGLSWRVIAGVAAVMLPVASVQPVAREALASAVPGSMQVVSAPSAPTVSPVSAAAEQSEKTAARVATSVAVTVADSVSHAVRAGVDAGIGAGAGPGIGAGVGGGVAGGIAGGVAGGIAGGVAGGIAGGVAGGVAPGIAGGITSGITATLRSLGLEQAAGEGSRRASPAVIAGLTEAMKDPDADVRKQAMQALTRLGAPVAYDALVAALRDEDPDLREQAAFSLGQSGDARAVEPLTAALKDPEADVRKQAAFALSQMKATQALPALRGALKDADEDVRKQALFALSQLGDSASVPAIIESLKDTSADVREQALFALSQVGDSSAVSAILPLLAKDESEDVRKQAAFALSQIGDESALDALTAAMKDASPDVRRQAIFALSQIADADDDDDERRERRYRKGQGLVKPTPTPTPTPSPRPAPQPQ